MKGILLRVGCDDTPEGGNWNAPVDPTTWEYAYVPIPANEDSWEHVAECPTFDLMADVVASLGVRLPESFRGRKAHLDPDFSSLSIGEPGTPTGLSSRGTQLDVLDVGDFIAFFAGFRPTEPGFSSPLAYCLFGLITITRKTRVHELDLRERAACAHGRRKGAEWDLVVWGRPELSGRFERAIPVGDWREGAYRVFPELLDQWGGLEVKNGWIQRSGKPPFFREPGRFLAWLRGRLEGTALLHGNW